MRCHLPIFRFHAIIIALLLCLLSATAKASGPILPFPYYSPGRYFDTVYDAYGGKYSLGEIAIDDTLRWHARGGTFSLARPFVCSSGYFQVYIDTGSGFETGAPDYVNRQRVLCQVLKDISSFIPSPLTSTGNHVNLWLKTSLPTGSTALGVGTPFFYMPHSPTITGISDNAMWITINSGRDAFENVASPLVISGGGGTGTTLFHGSLQINWGTAITWNTALGTSPASGDYDLYTVILHEVLHCMGFLSVISPANDSTGMSVFGMNHVNFTRFDKRLQKGGIPLIVSSSTLTPGCNALYDYTFNRAAFPSYVPVLSPGGCPGTTNHTDTTTAVFFMGTGSATRIPVYTPDCFEPGSSLCHFEDEYTTLGNDQYYLMSNSGSPGPVGTYPGAMKRKPTPEERQALCNIGYTVDSAFGEPPATGFPTGPNLNYVHYGSTRCGTPVAGICDGISGGTYSFVVSHGSSVTINGSGHSLLDNDHVGTGGRLKCLEVIIGAGTLTSDTGSATTVINYTPMWYTSGIQLLRYIPITATGEEGNITYLYIYVDDPGCTANPCDIVRNGSFENTDTGAAGAFPGVHCWYELNSADLYSKLVTGVYSIPATHIDSIDVHPLSATPNNYFIGMASLESSPGAYVAEYICQALTAPLTTGTTYTVSFWAKMIEGYTGHFSTGPTHVQFGVSSITPVIPFLPAVSSSLPAPLVPVFDIEIRDSGWHYYTDTFTYTSTTTANSIAMTIAPWLNAPGTYNDHYVFFDDISIVPSTSITTFTPPTDVCIDAIAFHLDPYLGASGLGGTYTWETLPVIGGVPTISHSELFDPANAYSADTTIGGDSTVVICYDYTDGLGCAKQVCAEVRLHNAPSPGAYAMTGGGNYCSGGVGLHVGLASSDAGISYQLYHSGIPVGSPVAGTGTAIGFGLQTLAGAYTVVATDTLTHCSSLMSSSVTITITTITLFSMSGSSAYCYTGSAFSMGLVGSTPGISYRLYRGATAIGTPVTGTGGAIGLGSWSTSGIYIVIATDPVAGCTDTMTGSVTIDPGPSLFTVTGGGSYCSGGTGIAVGLSGSATGVNYQLFIGASPTGSPVAGTGAAISFGLQTAVGFYTVKATNATTGCTNTMTGSVVVTINPLPGLFTVTGGGSYCVGDTGVHVHLSGSATGINYQLLLGGSPVGSPLAGTGGMLDFGLKTATGTYTVIATNATTGCTRTMTGSATVSTYTLTAITGLDTVCMGGTIVLSNSTPGGTWTSASPSIATVGPSTGIVAGISMGSANITYALSLGCYATKSVVVNFGPAPITGIGAMCDGLTTILSDATTGGTWTSSSPSIATIGLTTGIVTSVSAGVTTITYTITSTGCYTLRTVTVNPAPPPITGRFEFCRTTAVMLSDASPGGVWTSSDTSIALIDSITGLIPPTLVAGMAVITYTLPGGCYTTTTVTTYWLSACGPCASLGISFTTLGASGIINTNVATGRYFIKNNVTISGNITFNNAIVAIDTNVTITVDTSSLLTLDNAHLMSTCDVWKGIVLAHGYNHSGRLYTIHNSLQEDARIAVFIDQAKRPDTGYILYSDEAIFNRNLVGVDIENYAYMDTSYPFVIKNTVFASRIFSSPLMGGPGVWPPTNGIFGIKNYWNPGNVFDPPFNIDNPYAWSSVGYSSTTCKNGIEANLGIFLKNVGTYNSTTSIAGIPIPTTYAGIQIGNATTTTSNQNQNLFDGLHMGIYAINSNVTAVNNAFTNMYPYPMGTVPQGGNGILAIVNDDNIYHNRLRIYTPPGATYNNVFYGFTKAVECSNYFQVIGQNTYMINKSPGTFSRPLGSCGYSVSSSKYDTLDISFDSVTNVRNGITVWGTRNPFTMSGTPQQLTGYCRINNNLLRVHPSGMGSVTSESMQLGIAVQNIVRPAVGAAYTFNNVYVDGNLIQDAYNGIFANAFWKQKVTSNNNNISLRPDLSGIRRKQQYGINHTLDYLSEIENNYIVGNTTSARYSDSMRAVYMTANTGIDIGCNTENTLGRGFEYFLNSSVRYWHDNVMMSNRKGYVLNGAIIGAQNMTRPLNNSWAGTWSGLDTQTYVYKTRATFSPLYLRAGSTTNPSLNGGFPYAFRYTTGSGSIALVTTTVGFPCPIGPGTRSDAGNYEHVAQMHLIYTDFPMARHWMGQYELWNAIQMDSTLIDSSAVVAQFATMAAGRSRYAYLTDIENDIANGDFANARIKLGYNIDSMMNIDIDTATDVHMADDTTENYIVQNYQNFFDLYMKYIDSSLTTSDSLALVTLAHLCPERNGTVVYQARALYSIVFEDLNVFNDGECMEADTSFEAQWRHSNPGTTVATDGQQYKLYPNPNDGNFNLQQLLPDVEPVSAEVFDVLGRCVGREKLIFDNVATMLHVGNVSPGVYFLQIKDSKNRIFKFRFVIAK